LCAVQILRFGEPRCAPRRASVSARNRQRGVRRRVPGTFLHRAAVTHPFRHITGPLAGAGWEFAQLRDQVPSPAGRGHWEARFAAGGEMQSGKCRIRKGPCLSCHIVAENVRDSFPRALVRKSAPGGAVSGRKRAWPGAARGRQESDHRREKVLLLNGEVAEGFAHI